DVVLNEYAIMEHSEADRGEEFLRCIKPGRGVDDVIGLPLARRKADIGQRRVLSVNSASGTIGIGCVLERIHHLDFVTIEPKKHTAVAAPLTFTFGGIWRSPFNVQLAIAKILKGANVAAAFYTFHVAIARNPFGRRAVEADPLGEIFAVEQ